MWRIIYCLSASMGVLWPAPLPANPVLDARQAQYVAQRFAIAGYFAEADATLRASPGARLACRALVKLRTRGGDIPVCAPDASRVSNEATAQVRMRLDRARGMPSADAAKLLREALAIDPFDARVTAALAGALRSMGKSAEARAVEARAADLSRGRPVVWAGSR